MVPGAGTQQLLDNALIKLNAEIANRESESGEIKKQSAKRPSKPLGYDGSTRAIRRSWVFAE